MTISFLTTIGCSLKSLDLDSCTLSEILRLHILASGADVTSANAKYRYQKRGGFDATDDACMELRLSNPSLVKKLSSTSVYDLTPGKLCKLEFVPAHFLPSYSQKTNELMRNFMINQY